MSAPWSLVPLGRVLRHRKQVIRIDDLTTYKRCRVQLHAQGIVLRDTVTGAEIKTKQQQVCRAGEFLVAEIDAKVGGFGIVPQELAGAVVSSHYFLFEIDESALEPRFLDFYVRTPAFRDQVAAQGSTNYAAIRPSHVLGYTIPLPSLDEQRRIVARIEALAAKIEEARGAAAQASVQAELLVRAMLVDPSHQSTKTPMRTLVRLREPDVIVSPAETYPFAGVYCFGRGAFRGVDRKGLEFSYPRLTRLRAGDFMYPKLMAWEGAFAIVPPECDGLVVSTEFPVFELDQDRVLPETLDIYFRIPDVWAAISGVSTGTNVRRRRLNPSDFLNFEIPLPGLEAQRRLRDVRHRLAGAAVLRERQLTELDALLPGILDRAFAGEL